MWREESKKEKNSKSRNGALRGFVCARSEPIPVPVREMDPRCLKSLATDHERLKEKFERPAEGEQVRIFSHLPVFSVAERPQDHIPQ